MSSLFQPNPADDIHARVSRELRDFQALLEKSQRPGPLSDLVTTMLNVTKSCQSHWMKQKEGLDPETFVESAKRLSF